MYAGLVLEGTWEEIAARAEEFRGWRLRIEVVLGEERANRQDQTPDSESTTDVDGEG